MKKYILKRTLLLIPTCIGAFIFLFLIYSTMPGSVLDSTLYSIKNQDKIEAKYNINSPKYVKFIVMTKKIFTGKLEMYNLRIAAHPFYVMPVILTLAKSNLILIFSVIIVGIIVSIPLGIILSRKRNSIILRLIIYFFMSIPSYVLAIVINNIFKNGSIYYNYVNSHSTMQIVNFDDKLKNFIICFTLSIMYIAHFTKRVNVAINDVKTKQFVTTAIAYGFSKRLIEYKYILKNILVSIITFVGSSFSVIFAELIVVQSILKDNDGFGAFFLNMTFDRQYDAVFACLIIIMIIVVVGNYLADLFYFAVDPRIKAS
ncbi:ABC transporter permease subunit [Clostridium hydrogenum]|uniref:ABC transporter permease subunit n=1 Tax=Clostridium hydrogenum TaxID=2855764 RepID=UPI001F32C480|nr:ABC transporter permease [Clostridium hydrogenum]